MLSVLAWVHGTLVCSAWQVVPAAASAIFHANTGNETEHAARQRCFAMVFGDAPAPVLADWYTGELSLGWGASVDSHQYRYPELEAQGFAACNLDERAIALGAA